MLPDAEEQFKHAVSGAEDSFAKAVWRRFVRNKFAVAGAVILFILSLLSVLAPVLAPYGRDDFNLQSTFTLPSATHLLGTDDVGRDVLTRLLYGGRVSLTVALTCVVIYMSLGVIVGAAAGFFGGVVDNVLMRIVDVFVSFPFLPLLLTIVAIRGPSMTNLIGAICFLFWTTPARLVRGEILSLREREYVLAANAMGAPSWRIIARHLLPNALAPLIVQATLDIAGIILTEASLSFLGFGVKDPIPTWGNMMSQAQSLTVLTTRWNMWVPPGVAIFLSVLSINFLGDGLRDALDPRLKE